jgi:hypothetical protein
MKYLCWVFSRHGVQVVVDAELEIIQSVISLVSPYFEGRAQGEDLLHDVWTILARQNPAVSRVATNGAARLSYDEPFVSIIPEERLIVVEEAQDKLVVQRVLRLLRDLFRLQAPAGSVFVHGGMIETAGCGIALLGAQQAGKTSLLLALLTQMQAAFVDNDVLSFHLFGERPFGLGWPRAINIRRDTLVVLDAVLAEKQTQFSQVRLSPSKPKETVSLSPRVFADTFGCSLVAQAELHMIVFPAFLPREETPAFSLLSLTKEEALIALKEQITSVPSAYHHFLRPYFPLSPQEAHYVDQTIEQLARQVPCYRLWQSFSAIAAAAQAVIALTAPSIQYCSSMSNDRTASI